MIFLSSRLPVNFISQITDGFGFWQTISAKNTAKQPLSKIPEIAYELVRKYNDGALIDLPEKNLLLLKVKHEGPELSSEQRGIVIQWLNLEHDGQLAPGLEKSLIDAVDNFAACMNKDEFMAQQLNQLSAIRLAGASCDVCHSLAQASISGGRFILDPKADNTLTKFQQLPGVLKLVTPVVASNGVFLELRESLRIVRKGNELNQQGSTMCANEAVEKEIAAAKGGLGIDVDDSLYCHPNYTLPPNLEDQLHQFVASTLQRAKTQVCSDSNGP